MKIPKASAAPNITIVPTISGTYGVSRERSGGVPTLSRLDFQDLELERAAGCADLDGLALLLADDRLADRRLVRQLVLRGVGLGRADDVVLDRLLGRNVAELHLRADRDDILGDVLLGDDARIAQAFLERGDAVLEQHLLVLRVVVLGVLRNVAELAGDPDALRHLAALCGRELLDFCLQLLVALRCEDDFLHGGYTPSYEKTRRWRRR